uniref:Uncharacterized protein n=1 Tax=Anguilla anguilla TaxID=7936 RepID=A0A0E9W674_ANGAN
MILFAHLKLLICSLPSHSWGNVHTSD